MIKYSTYFTVISLQILSKLEVSIYLLLGALILFSCAKALSSSIDCTNAKLYSTHSQTEQPILLALPKPIQTILL